MVVKKFGHPPLRLTGVIPGRPPGAGDGCYCLIFGIVNGSAVLRNGGLWLYYTFYYSWSEHRYSLDAYDTSVAY